MIRPILACDDPYETAKKFIDAGWHLDFSQPPESGDPLLGVSLYDNSILLGITNGYVSETRKPYIGCGIELYMTVPTGNLEQIHDRHKRLGPSEIIFQPWGEYAFEVYIDKFEFMIASK